MHNNYQGIALSFALFFMLSFSGLYAQKGFIEGIVTDSASAEAAIGANVVIQGTVNGSSTDINGFYAIRNLDAGTYTLVVTYIGYIDKVIPNVVVQDGQATKLDIVISEDAEVLEAVEVFGKRITRSEVAVINEIKAKDVVVSGISGDQIARSMDRNVAQVTRRISGVSITDGRFVMVRGINQRYNTTQINGINAPSLEADRKSFSFDILPSSVLDRLLVYKSGSPDLPADFAGGLIRVYTKDIPDENEFIIKYSSSFRVGTTFNDFLEQPQGNLGWLGFDDGTYSVPEGIPAQSLNPNEVNAISTNERVLYSQLFNVDTWLPNENTAIPDQRLNFQANLNFPIGDNKNLGSLTLVSYSNTYTRWQGTRQLFVGTDTIPKNAETDTIPTKQFQYQYEDNVYEHEIRLTGMQNFGFRFNSRNKIDWKNLYTRNAQYRYLYREGNDSGLNRGQYNSLINELSNTFRQVYATQLSGEHEFLENGDLKIKWIGGYSYTFRETPDVRRYQQFQQDEGAPVQNAFATVAASASARDLGRFYSDNTENTYSGALDLDYKLNIKGYRPRVMLGGYVEKKDKDFGLRQFGFIGGSVATNEFTFIPLDSLFRAENFNRENKLTVSEISEVNRSNFSYDGTIDLFAAYFKLDLPIGNRVNISGGVRMEDNRQVVNGTVQNSSEEIQAVLDTVNWLPSVNIKYTPSEKWQLRASYFKSLNRPELREMSPFTFPDFASGFDVTGNPEIEVAYIDNADMRVEYYPNIGESISLGGFYKRFDSPIEPSFISSNNGLILIPRNADEATSYGLELELRKSLAQVFKNSSVLKNITIVANAAWIESEVELDSQFTALQAPVRPMAGQSRWMVNGGLYYDNENIGLNITLFYNAIGPRLSIVGVDQDPDIYEMTRHLLDLTFSKRFGENWELFGGVSNILDAPYLFIADGNADGNLDKNQDIYVGPSVGDNPPEVGPGDYNWLKYTVGQYINIGFKVRL